MSILRCTESFAVMNGHIPRVLRAGDTVYDNDPVVKGHEASFEPLEDHIARVTSVEAATAAPGEKRSVTRPRKATAKKAAAKKATPK
jgi:hypothetical protein